MVMEVLVLLPYYHKSDIMNVVWTEDHACRSLKILPPTFKVLKNEFCITIFVEKKSKLLCSHFLTLPMWLETSLKHNLRSIPSIPYNPLILPPGNVHKSGLHLSELVFIKQIPYLIPSCSQ